MNKEPITVAGLKNLKSELENLKNIQRPKIVEAIAEARSHGDLKENAEYHAAKEQQALIESRIIAINDLIARANVIDVTKIDNDGKVIFGSTVKVQDLDSNKEITYKLVGQDEADISKNLIFYKSPIGKALISKNKSVNIGSKKFKNWIIEKIKGITTDNKEPMNGIKFNKKESTPNVGAKSLFKKNRTVKVNIPVIVLVNVFSWK